MNRNSVGIVTGSPGGIYSQLGQNLVTLLDDRCSANPFRVVAILGIGSRGNLDDIKNLRRVDIGLVQNDVLDGLPADERRRLYGDIRYIAPLHLEAIHILAARGITRVEDLNNRRVNVDRQGSGSYFTADNVFRKLGIQPKLIDFAPTAVARKRLIDGELDALIFVAGRGVSVFTGIELDQALARQLHFVPLPHSLSVLSPTYSPVKLLYEDYKSLFNPGGEVETWAARAVMAVWAWDRVPCTPSQQERYESVSTFVSRFFHAAPKLGSDYGGFWCEMDLAGEVPGWRRFDAAADWLAANQRAQTRPCGKPPPSCELRFRDEINQKAGLDPDLSRPYWRDEFAQWRQRTGCT